MSLIVTGTNLIIALGVLIAINGFLALIKNPIFGFIVSAITVIFLLAFPIDFNGLSLLLTLLLIGCLIANIVSSYLEFNKK